MPDHQPLPEQFGRYRILKQLGAGGMGAVYLAHDTRLDRKIALKVPHFSDARPEVVQRFLREQRIAAGLDHPHLCPVYDADAVNGICYFTMPFIEGQPLANLIAVDRPWPPTQALQLVRQVALAVAVLHRNKLIHRDLKPANIMLRATGDPVVMDFGLARSCGDNSERVTAQGAIIGTPAYMSPEQIDGEAEVGPPSDVYSLGVILYELLTGRTPFQGPLTSLFSQIATKMPTPPSQVRSGLPPQLDALCNKAMAKRPGDRFISMEAFAEALLAPMPGVVTLPDATLPIPIAQPVMATAIPLAQTTTMPMQRPPRKRQPLILAAVAVLLVGTIAVWLATRGSKDDKPDDAGQPPKTPAKPALMQKEWTNSIGMKLRRIEAGKFKRGEEVEITRPFYIGVYEVTNDAFRQFADEAKYKTDAENEDKMNWRKPGYKLEDDVPVVCVSWHDANAFCDWLSKKEDRKYTLPTEAEWEYACRAGTTTLYYFSDFDTVLRAHAWIHGGGEYAHRVGYKLPNNWGLYDMHGNVSEWCQDWFADYRPGPSKDPVGPKSGTEKSHRGGSWESLTQNCTVASRFHLAPKASSQMVGFRVVLRPE